MQLRTEWRGRWSGHPPTLRSVRRGALLIVANLLAAVLPVLVAGTAAAAPPSVDGTVAAGRDYATDILGDPWDYSNPEDILLDNGPSMSLVNPRVADGQLQTGFSGNGYVSPLWPGYQGSLLLGRDGAAAGNALDGSVYGTVALQIWSGADASAGLMWFNCPGGGVAASCGGGLSFQVSAGWHTYVLRPGASVYSGWPLAWGLGMTGLRVAVSPAAGPVQISVDWIRVVRPNSGAQVTWSSPGGQADLIWDSDSDPSNNTPGAAGWGVLATGNGSGMTADASVLPPGRYWFSVRSAAGRGAVSGPVSLDAPHPVVVSPDEIGQQDYAASQLGDAWDMNSLGDTNGIGNATNVSFSNGALAATNTTNDPFVWLRTGNIDATKYHRLTVTEAYDGPFDLTDTAGGGTMGRIIWRRADLGDTIMQTKDIVTYSGRRRITIDMSQPPSLLNEETAPNPYPFVSASAVTALRWDPNEDRGPRRWYLDDVQLRSDWTAHRAFAVKWYEASPGAGGTAEVVAATDRTGCSGPVIQPAQPVTAGTNVAVWDTSGVAPGKYWVCVRATRGQAIAEQHSKGPIVVSGSAPAGAAPAVPAAPEVSGMAAAATVQWPAPASPGSELVGYQLRLVQTGEVRTLGALSPGATWTGLAPGASVQFQVRALNDAGWSGWSTASATLVVPGSAAPGTLYLPRGPIRVMQVVLGPGGTARLPLTGAYGAPTNVDAVALNVTSTDVTVGGYLSVYPTGASSGPATSNLNLSAGQDIPNAVTTKVGPDGSITLFNSVGTVRVLVDLQGWYTSSGGFGYHPVDPVRVVDTRVGLAASGPLGGPDQRVVTVAGVPAGAAAFAANVTATATTGHGFVSVFPPGQPDGTTTSSLNTYEGHDIPNLVTSKLDATGRTTLFNNTFTTELVADLQGWFGNSGGLAYTPVPPWRVLDTRSGLGGVPARLGTGQVLRLQVAGAPGSGVPAGAKVVVLNLTATNVDSPNTYVSVAPAGSATLGATSSVNLRGGETRPNLVVAKLGPGGDLDLRNNLGKLDLVVDVAGFYN